MDWNRSKTIGLASLRCPQCDGLGLVAGLKGTVNPCPCVLRKVFRICWNRFKFGRLEQMERGAPILNISGLGRRAHRQPGGFSFSLECYLADIAIVSRRALSADDFVFFEKAYLSGVDWKRAHEAVKMTRPQFMYVCKRLEPQLGKAFLDCEPFSLLPDQYFTRPAPGTRTPAFAAPLPTRTRIPLRPPLAPRQSLKRAA